MAFKPGSRPTTGSSSDLKSGPMLSSGRRALSPARDVTAKYEGMVALLTSQPCISSILEKRIDSADVESLARSLIHISQAQKTTCATIHGMIRMEFSCKQVNTILRGNSLTTKLQTTFCRQVGKDYLKTLFGSILLRLVTDTDLDLSTSEQRLQLESETVNKQTRLEENRRRVMDITQEFIDRFTSQEMMDEMPRPIRAIAAYTAQFAKLYTPDRVLQFVGGFILLRFYNPAIITPEALQMLPEGIIPSAQDRQNLIAITRLLQKLSNQVLTLDPEEQDWVNPFIEKNRDVLKKYLADICEDSQCKPGELPYSEFLDGDGSIMPNSTMEEKHLHFLHKCFFESGKYVVEELTEKGTEEDLEVAAQFLQTSMLLGPPPSSVCRAAVPKLRDQCRGQPHFWLPSWAPQFPDGSPVRSRFGHTATKVGGSVYIFGGSYSDGSPVQGEDTLLRCDLRSKTWEQLGSDSCPARKFHTAAESNGSLYIFGGIHKKETLNDMHVYCVKERRWATVAYKNTPPDPRYGHVMHFCNGMLIVFGGYKFDGKKYVYTNTTHMFNLETAQWIEGQLANSPSVRTHHAAAVHKGSIWMFGGRTPEMDGLGDLYRYDAALCNWKKAGQRGTAPSPRWGHTMTVVSKSKMIVFGGCSDIETFRDAHEFNFDTQTWTEVRGDESWQSPSAVAHHATIAMDGRLYSLFGGTYTTTGTLCDTVQELAYDFFQEPPNRLTSDYAKMVNSSFCSDISLFVGEKEFFAHKLILHHRAPGLYEIAEQHGFRLHLGEDVSEQILNTALRFVYLGEKPNLTLHQGLGMVAFCRTYHMPELLRLTELGLEKMVHDNNILTLLRCAEEYNLNVLELSCISYFKTGTHSFFEQFPFDQCSPKLIRILGEQLFRKRKNN